MMMIRPRFLSSSSNGSSNTPSASSSSLQQQLLQVLPQRQHALTIQDKIDDDADEEEAMSLGDDSRRRSRALYPPRGAPWTTSSSSTPSSHTRTIIALMSVAMMIFLFMVGLTQLVPPLLYTGRSALSTTLSSEDEVRFETRSWSAPLCHRLDSIEQVDFTLVTHISPERLWLMKDHCRQWKNHSMSIAVSGSLPVSVLKRALAQMQCDMNHIHVATLEHYYSAQEEEEEGHHHDDDVYPVNALRNLALSHVRTSHALIIDVDFVLSQHAYDALQQTRSILASNPYAAVVMPVLEFHPAASLCPNAENDDNSNNNDDGHCHELQLNTIPRTVQELKEFMVVEEEYDAGEEDSSSSRDHHHSRLDTQWMAPFDSTTNVGGHGSTDYERWLLNQPDAPSATGVRPISCLSSNRYEPYLVVRYCQSLPPFPEAFQGYGMNKVSWIRHLRHVGYQFYVPELDPDQDESSSLFAVHVPHAKSKSWANWYHERIGGGGGDITTTPSDGRALLLQQRHTQKTEMDQLALQFQHWLETTVTNHAVMPYCSIEAELDKDPDLNMIV